MTRDIRTPADLQGLMRAQFPPSDEQFAAMIDLRYQVAPAQFNLGLIAQKRGDSKEAGRRFRLALEADPAFKPARDALAKLK